MFEVLDPHVRSRHWLPQRLREGRTGQGRIFLKSEIFSQSEILLQDRKIWGLTGDAGNNWYMGQAPIASTENFRVRRD